MNRSAITPALLAVLAFSGCASTLSGVGGADGYACKAPVGALCTSVSGVYANSIEPLPKPATTPAKLSSPAVPAGHEAPSIARGSPAVVPGSSIRSNPRLLRLWIAPWEDADGDLHEAALVHVIVDTGRWLIEHVRPAPRSRMEDVAPPVSPAPSPAKTPTETPQSPSRFPLPPASASSGFGSAPVER